MVPVAKISLKASINGGTRQSEKHWPEVITPFDTSN